MGPCAWAEVVTREGQANTTEAYGELVSDSFIEPVALGTVDERTWADCDLASLAETRLGVSLDPRAFDDPRPEARAVLREPRAGRR